MVGCNKEQLYALVDAEAGILIYSLSKKRDLPPIQFKFDVNWLSNPELFPLMEKFWNKQCRARTTLDKIQQKLKLFQQFFKRWGFNLQGELRKKRAAN